MTWTRDIQDALSAPFPSDEIEFLPRAIGSGRALALPHIDARSVMRRLDAVVTPEGWEFDFDVVSPDGKRVKGILTVLDVTKCDAGEAAAEDEPLKAAVSDALKRCGVHFGIARYLYCLPQIWAAYDAAKKRWTDQPKIPAGALERALAICGYQGTDPNPPTAEHPARETTPESQGDRAARSHVQRAEREPEPPLGALVGHCSTPGCGKTLTKGQHDVSMRTFKQPLCPGCQRQQARNA